MTGKIETSEIETGEFEIRVNSEKTNAYRPS